MTDSISSDEYRQIAKGEKRSKYGNVPTDGFHSKAERDRYIDLEMLRIGGSITDLQLQPKFEVIVNDKRICTYIADFQYRENGQIVVEDVKGGASTPVYRLKKKLVEAIYGVKIREVRK